MYKLLLQSTVFILLLSFFFVLSLLTTYLLLLLFGTFVHLRLPIYIFILIVPFPLSTSHLPLFNSVLCILLQPNSLAAAMILDHEISTLTLENSGGTETKALSLKSNIYLLYSSSFPLIPPPSPPYHYHSHSHSHYLNLAVLDDQIRIYCKHCLLNIS